MTRRVAYVMTNYPKLAQTFLAGEIDALERAGVEVACFAMNAPEPFERARDGAERRIAGTTYLKQNAAKALIILAGKTLRHPLAMARVWAKAIASGGGNPGRTLRRLAHLAQAALVARRIKEAGIERVHAHFGLAPATIAWLACAIRRAEGGQCAFSFTIHGYHDFVDPGETRLDVKARDAATVLCVSDFTRSQLYLNSAPELWSRFHVARCGIDLATFAYRDPPAPGPEPTVMALGRLSPEKGFAVLIRAIARLAGDGRRVRLRLVGDGPTRADLERAAQEGGVTDLVTFTGELPPEQVRAELTAADIFCMASFSEGLPVSLMEAMAIGVPCVTTWIAGIPELAENEVTALTVPPARADALAAAIERLAADPNLGTTLARAARERVAALHDSDACARRVVELILPETGHGG
jgi:colanic acid/amylovoran biosynthesis glycosyltransferase